MTDLGERDIDEENGCQAEEYDERPFAPFISVRNGQYSCCKEKYHHHQREIVIHCADQPH